MILATVMRRFIRFGTVSLIDADGVRHQICNQGQPIIVLRLTDKAVAKRLLLPSTTLWGEAYMNGSLVIEEGTLGDMVEVFGRSESLASEGWVGDLLRRLRSFIFAAAHYNPMDRARRNVAHHYDLSAGLYDQFLDADRQYSCAYFPTGKEDIDTAQHLKKRHIAAKLNIKPGMTVLDIGSGWGGMALYLARLCDCQVLGVTLSEEQLSYSQRRVREAGLSHLVRFELRDYRSLSEPVDRIVSIGMLEHVGQYQYGEYFEKVRELLKPGGIALVHTIARMNKPRPINAWMRKYIFPGAYLPTTSQLARATEKTGLWLADIENLRLHYAKTLVCWQQRFSANWQEVASIYDERFCRMWALYLTGCEMAFRLQKLTVLQLQLCREIDALPMTRDYMLEAERELALRDLDLAGNPRDQAAASGRRHRLKVARS